MDERVSDNERVTSAPCLRFYAGVPLRTADRHNIGALCTMDTRPRIVTRSQITMLETLAKSVLRTIEERSTADQAAARRMTGRD
jgi:GAF domain-containing protein